MDADTFWEIIAAAKARTGPGRPFAQALADHLVTLSEQGILESNYAAMEAYERVTGIRDGFNDAWARYQGPPQPRGQDPAGEDFDFDDPQQVRRRLPRLSAIFLAGGPA